MQTELSEGFDKRFAYIENTLARAMLAEKAERKFLSENFAPGSDPAPRVTYLGTGYSETASSPGRDKNPYDDPAFFNCHAPSEDSQLFDDEKSTGSGRSSHDTSVDRENRRTDDEGTLDPESDREDVIKSTKSAPLTLENFSKGKEGGDPNVERSDVRWRRMIGKVKVNLAQSSEIEQVKPKVVASRVHTLLPGLPFAGKDEAPTLPVEGLVSQSWTRYSE
jgi:hypothetical protein